MQIRKYLIIGVVALSPLLMANQGCEQSPSSAVIEQRQQERNQNKLFKVQPPPQLSTSAERKNLIERLKRLNTENMTGCVDLFSGPTHVARYTVRGKVTSLNSYLTGKEKPAYFGGSRDENGNYVGGVGWQMVESPDYDGAYGENVHGIFFFTADTNAYVEWKGEYLFTDQCLTSSVRPLMVRSIN